MPVKGAPDVVFSIDPKSPEELFVFLGMAMLEKVPRLHAHRERSHSIRSLFSRQDGMVLAGCGEAAFSNARLIISMLARA